MTYINHFTSQFAGEVGVVSLGLGKEFKRYSIGGMYGFVPAEVSGTSAIETITLRQTYEYFHWKKLSFHTGLNIFHVLGVKYETSSYGESPDKYYPIGSVRGLLNLGVSAAFDKKEASIVYFEMGLNDIAITNYIANSDVINPINELSLAMGFKKRF